MAFPSATEKRTVYATIDHDYDRTYTLHTQRFIKSALLRLPSELCHRICSFVLEEPLRWARRHNAFCPFSERNTTVPETPPFEIKSPRCHCTRRRNLGLLLTNRQIHAVAAPIFWRQSTFYFDSAASFVVDCLRDAYRESIRHVIVNKHSDDDLSTKSSMWKAIHAFKSLRTLTMKPELVETTDLLNLRSSHPHLEFFGLFHVLEWGGLASSPFWTRTRQKTVYVATVYKFPLHSEKFGSAEGMHLTANGTWNDVLHHTGEMVTSAMKRLRHKRDYWRNRYYRRYTRVREGINLTNNPASRWDGSTGIRVWMNGLPNSEVIRKSHAMERIRYEASRKAAGLPTSQESLAALQVQQTKKKRKEESRRLQYQFEVAMRERNINIRRHKRDREPEDPRLTKRKEKLQAKSRTLVIREKRLNKYQALRDYIRLEA